MKNLGLLIAHRIRLKRNGGLHGGQAEKLHHMVRDHVPEGSCSVEVTAPAFHSDRLCIRNLYMVNVTPVPDGLENGIVKRKTMMFCTVSLPK